MTRDNTTDRGYGWDHQQERERQLDHLRHHPGLPCPRCGRPMHPDQKLDLGHRDDLATHGPHHPGPRRLEHARCNRQAGQALATARRTGRTPRSRNW